MRITEKNLGRYFKILGGLIEHSMNRRLQELDLTSAQGHIIGFLTCSSEAPCARDIESYFGLSHPTVSGLLSRMEAKGFIEVRSDEKDRRVKRIYLLEKGLSCSKQIGSCVMENECLMTKGFTPEETALFRVFLQRSIDNLSNHS